MNIIVAGCGKIGKSIVANLVNEKHNVKAIDNDQEVIASVVNEYDVIGILGNATEYDKLVAADVKYADLFIATTNSDEINMLACFAAKRLGAKHTVARIRSAENNDGTSLEFMKTQLNLSMSINPEMLTAESIFNIIKLPSAAKVQTFGSHRLEMIELSLKDDSPLDGVSLMELRKKTKEKFLICTVKRDDKIYIPQGDFRLKSGDKVGVISSGKDTQRILKTFGVIHKPIRDVLIIGAGRTSYYLAKMLQDSTIRTKVIEINGQRCEEFLEKLPGVTVIHGDGTSRDILEEEGIQTADAFVSLMGRDEENILVSFYALSRKTPKIITKINGESRSYLAEKLGLESIASPKTITADALVQYARALKNSEGSKVETLYSLGDGAEALEFNVLPDFGHLEIPLKEINFKQNILLAGIIRNREAIIPAGDDVIKAGDRVIVVATGQHIYDLASIIKETK